MLFRKLLGGAALSALALGMAVPVQAQVVSSTLRAEVSAPDGTPVSGAQVEIVNTNTGAVTRATTGEGGSLTAPGMPIGGPYIVRVNADGYAPRELNDVYLSLGETLRLRVGLESLTPSEETIVVTGERGTKKIDQRGVADSFGERNISSYPTFSGDPKEVIQQLPYAFIDPVGGGNSPPVPTLNIAGANPRCTNFLVDGLQQKDNFGLNLQGFPTARAPLPTPWTEQIQVAVTPYDVEYNDTCGGVINIVTKEGTNDFHGSAYFVESSERWTGKAIENRKPTKGDLLEQRYGFTLGGPIIEDTLFFFVGYDYLEHTEPLTNAVGAADSNASRRAPGIFQSEIDQVIDIAQNVYGFNPLDVQDAFTEQNERWMGKLTWQINDDHRIIGTYQNVVGGTLAITGGNTSTTTPQVSLPSNWYKDAEEMEAYSVQIYDDWSENFSTQFHIGRVDIHGGQDPLAGTNFPEVYVRVPGPNGVININPPSGTGSDDGYIRIGPDFSRHFNLLDYVNDFAKLIGIYTVDEHTIKGGLEHREIDIFNSFVQGAQSVVRFDSITDFQNGNIATSIDNRGNATSTSTQAGNPIYYGSGVGGDLSDASAIFNFDINSGYVQDEWFPTEEIAIQFGIRYDRYASDTEPALNTSFRSRYGFSNQKNLDGLDAILPRLSASYDWAPEWDGWEEIAATLRGGVGRYSGGFQTVWISNSYSVTGVTQLSVFGVPGVNGSGGDFSGVPTNILLGPGGTYDHELWLDELNTGPLASASTQRNSTVNALLPSFELPKNWRANVGLDIALGDVDVLSGFLDGWNATFDFLYLLGEDQPYWTNLRVQPSAVRAPDGRFMYQLTFDPAAGRPDPANPACTPTTPPVPVGCTAVTGTDIGLGSYDGGEGTFLIAALRKNWDDTGAGDFELNLGYTHSDVTDVSASTSSTANSNYVNRASVNYNEPEEGRSDYEREHRFTTSLTWSENFFEDLETRLSIFGQRTSGQPYSMVFNGNPFGPAGGGVTGRSLVYVPGVNPATGLVDATSDPLVTYGPAFNFANFNAMLLRTGLLQYAGGITPRNGFDGPWSSRVDVGLQQELPVGISDHRLVLEAKLFNLGNLLNRDWGVYDSPGFYQAYSAITAGGTGSGCAGAAPINGSNQYVYCDFAANPATINNTQSASVWQLQLGARYQF